MVASGERDRRRPGQPGDRQGVRARLPAALGDGRRDEERLRRSALRERPEGLVHAGARRRPLGAYLEAHSAGSAARAHLLARHHHGARARNARAGDRRQDGRRCRLRRRDADSRGRPAVEREPEHLLEAPTARARDGRSVHGEELDAVRCRNGARLHAREDLRLRRHDVRRIVQPLPQRREERRERARDRRRADRRSAGRLRGRGLRGAGDASASARFLAPRSDRAPGARRARARSGRLRPAIRAARRRSVSGPGAR